MCSSYTSGVTTLDLTRRLLAFDTINPPGNERPCALALAEFLEDAGLHVAAYDFEPGRTSLVATLHGDGSGAPIVLTGHLDTVPLGAAPWSCDPFAGEIGDGRIYGRGTCDMKGAVAAMAVATRRLAALHHRRADVRLVFTAGEERGCHGAQHLASLPGVLGAAGAMVVGEPTGNQAWIAHKGCLRFNLTARGVTAHASMPEQGDNAIHKAAAAVMALSRFEFGVEPHPLLGRPTLNIGTIAGGMNVNSVPDTTVVGLDIRTIPGLSDDHVHGKVHATVGDWAEVERVESGAAVESDPDDPWVQQTLDVLQELQGHRPRLGSAPYFTDAAFLKPALGDPPTLLFGPGDAEVAHKTDEYCDLAKLELAEEAYFEIIRRWCRT